MTGWAAISLPLGVTSQGLPIGVRLIPDEAVLLQLAAQLEVARRGYIDGPVCNVARMVRDIRELTDSPEAYAAELRRRWAAS